MLTANSAATGGNGERSPLEARAPEASSRCRPPRGHRTYGDPNVDLGPRAHLGAPALGGLLPALGENLGGRLTGPLLGLLLCLFEKRELGAIRHSTLPGRFLHLLHLGLGQAHHFLELVLLPLELLAQGLAFLQVEELQQVVVVGLAVRGGRVLLAPGVLDEELVRDDHILVQFLDLLARPAVLHALDLAGGGIVAQQVRKLPEVNLPVVGDDRLVALPDVLEDALAVVDPHEVAEEKAKLLRLALLGQLQAGACVQHVKENEMHGHGVPDDSLLEELAGEARLRGHPLHYPVGRQPPQAVHHALPGVAPELCSPELLHD
mmetsp:Transcript_11745/g.31090  ORF Transcript_11745/g.31090 Transcript_11745/m.31090 type:complete len:320 (-) Transcript_11745:270-1229(-)